MKRRLYIAAVNNRYSSNVFLPLAAGLMWAYARRRPEIADAYELCDMLYMKEPIDVALARLDRPDVLALSSYIWNWEWNKALAKEVKQRWPRCVILVGGVQVPNASPRVLDENPQFDFAIYGEGERAFADFLQAHANERDYWNVGSLVWRDDGHVCVNERAKPVELDEIPSPYLEGLFDHLVADKRWMWNALQETNRGCPYSCTFCAWGDGAQTKLNRFSEERVRAEFEWFGWHGIEVLYNADANWGILKRDIALTDALVDTKQRFGAPRRFRAAFAKNSNDVVFEISKKLSDADMLKATTLALQSMQDDTLGLIKRKNIRYEKLQQLSARYEAADIATYTELIIGLPGETYTSFADGIDALLSAGQHDGLSIYLCMLLENTEMATPTYREAHGIQSAPMRALLYHGTLEPGVPEEIQETVIATATMPELDHDRAVLFAWFVQALHGFGLTQHLARMLNKHDGTRFKHFYEMFYDWACAVPDSVIGREVARMHEVWRAAKRGETWPTVEERFGDVMWPPEELLFLRVACDSERFYNELAQIYADDPHGRVFVAEQRSIFIPPAPGSEAEYAREAVWYNRKGSAKLRIRK